MVGHSSFAFFLFQPHVGADVYQDPSSTLLINNRVGQTNMRCDLLKRSLIIVLV